MQKIIEKLYNQRSLTEEEYGKLVKGRSREAAEMLAELARKRALSVYGSKIFIRGLIEISNYCKNDCLYCGIRRSNKNTQRYRLTKQEILDCCEEGYPLGFRTFVMQGGEDAYFNDERVCDIVSEIKKRYPDTAVTLSLGERSYESYKALREAGADRYLLRHETASCDHYARLHPKELTLENRMRCLNDLRSLGYQVGCGFMVQSPYQSIENIAKDLKFIEEFSPEMCGIGPFIPHLDTPFKDEKAGSAELTCYLLSIIRIMKPNILLPATTALGSIAGDGRLKGILSGANVVMPNLSPQSVRRKYSLYNNKLYTGAESAQALEELKKQLSSIGYDIVCDKGDFNKTNI
ncbi:MAG: [FeFe] hydrogenase H-cluster radical SAM maturase HydE [Ruminococcaceae bacterium]|nr:[FeFe] hydrogenase H-cluster radical SAM maturase HydE [Oscillospiraceae bacterium]